MPTLSHFVHDKSDKEQLNKDTKSDELGETNTDNVFQQMKNIPVAGRPSESTSGSGSRRSISKQFSRRNSVDDNASSLSLENLGGSQDNLSLLGRNPDKEMRIHTGRRPDQAELNNERYMDNRDVEEMERRQRESMSPVKYVRLSDSPSATGQQASPSNPEHKVSFADLRKQKARDQFHSSGINITYTEQEKEDMPKKSLAGMGQSLLARRDSQRSSNDATSDQQSPDAMAAQLNSVRLKLEQRRKRIEDEKRKMEAVMAKQREKVGQEAFLRAVVKGTVID